MPRKYQLHHGVFEIFYGGLDGLCVFPDRLAPRSPEEFWIWIDDRLRGQKKLDSLLHELIHAEHPEMSEEDVARTASNIAGAVFGEGWRDRK